MIHGSRLTRHTFVKTTSPEDSKPPGSLSQFKAPTPYLGLSQNPAEHASQQCSVKRHLPASTSQLGLPFPGSPDQRERSVVFFAPFVTQPPRASIKGKLVAMKTTHPISLADVPMYTFLVDDFRGQPRSRYIDIGCLLCLVPPQAGHYPPQPAAGAQDKPFASIMLYRWKIYSLNVNHLLTGSLREQGLQIPKCSSFFHSAKF